MAPPPPADLPLGQRVAKLAQTLQFAWFVGYVSLRIVDFLGSCVGTWRHRSLRADV
ncbi:hypothetical protein CONLIGDRAFT_632997 [Coniochaeta ligniaria NRRL 30616]|uniref:Uncharacterized protein n=1 Tax=Coniochaeta ligniaria NRRL 30616 TaxID=1408157 RepID=A0A1J7IMH5_9PEZI|nr:hypothetical protein CONLIGDRAFT_632997 [Coniochaeta ligniaria NRRL 30616]